MLAARRGGSHPVLRPVGAAALELGRVTLTCLVVVVVAVAIVGPFRGDAVERRTGPNATPDEVVPVAALVEADASYIDHVGDAIGDLLRGRFGDDVVDRRDGSSRSSSARPLLAATAPITVQVVAVAFVLTGVVAAALRWLGRRVPVVDRWARRLLDTGASIPTFLAVLFVWQLFIVTEEEWLLPFRWVRLTDDPLRSIARTIIPAAIVATVLLPFARLEARRSPVAPVPGRRIVVVRALRRELRVMRRGLPLAVSATVLIETGFEYGGLGLAAVAAVVLLPNPGRLEAVLVATGIAIVLVRALAEIADRSLARLDVDGR
jgi:ABC-type dipeptide/oligopeptide/nickel transport system permease component